MVLITVLCISPAAAQVISGSVTDEQNNPLPDAHLKIQVQGTNYTTITDLNGTFELSIEPETGSTLTLYVTRVGYKPEVLQIAGSAISSEELTIVLTEQIYQQETVVVTATRTQRDIEEVSIPVSVISGEEIQHSGNMRLSDVLAEQTGMQLVSDHGPGIQVQGFDPDYTLIMIDGNPVIGRTAGTLDLSRISVRNVEQIEVVKGPSSALWGSDALAGVVNIITETARRGLSGGFTTRYGGNKTLDISGDISHAGETFQNRIFINRNTSGGYRLNPGSVSQTVPEYQNYTLNYSGSVDISDRLTLDANFRWFSETQQNNSSVNTENGALLLNDYAGRSDVMVNPVLTFNPADRLDFTINWLSSHYGTDLELFISDSGDLYDSTEFNQYFNRPEFQGEYRWSNQHHSIAGTGAIFERLEAERYPGQPDFTTRFLFAQHSWTPSTNVELTGGLRFDSHSEYRSQLSPKVSARYRMNERIQFRASAGRGFKAPEFRQLFLDFTNSTVGYSVLGSSTVADGIARQLDEGTIDQILIPLENLEEIRAESSWAINAGVDVDPLRNLRLRINFFRNNVSDLIETAPIARRTNGQSVFTYFNVDEVVTQGLEAEIRWSVSRNLNGSAGYQFLDANRRIERERTVQDSRGEVVQRTDVSFEPMFNRSRHSGNIRLFYETDSGWGANVRGTLRGRFGLFDSNGSGFVDGDEYEKGYTVWNAAVSRTFGNSVRLQAGADNLLGYTNINQPFLAGRLWYTQLSVQF
ncbi:TonB-dependent receptor [Rhodohalobacter mucosus]|nr:TonB-dependent receptor [Rhodohalobacter mucosus]